MADVNADSERSVMGAWARVRVSCSLGCMGNIGLWLEFQSGTDVRMRA